MIHVLGVHAMPVLKLRKYILAIDDIDERKKQAYRWKDHQTALDVSFQSYLVENKLRDKLKIPINYGL